jgi:hypothetical protein
VLLYLICELDSIEVGDSSLQTEAVSSREETGRARAPRCEDDSNAALYASPPRLGDALIRASEWRAGECYRAKFLPIRAQPCDIQRPSEEESKLRPPRSARPPQDARRRTLHWLTRALPSRHELNRWRASRVAHVDQLSPGRRELCAGYLRSGHCFTFLYCDIVSSLFYGWKKSDMAFKFFFFQERASEEF